MKIFWFLHSNDSRSGHQSGGEDLRSSRLVLGVTFLSFVAFFA